ncbi:MULTISPECIES: DUF3137 domain-containing protein [unclassified Campylobacter]|uniref:DUF3137 domain-containing protein n=1 Tax=unclassified Campylobacter TaxID=2593542 RepID=UPI0022E9C7DB|nr:MULTISPECIES: DUF3137 domain-containing protein [unclassified Campylobacter]MDA3056627.1 DUF3137 domain-containing protein [Campylobacter sp. CN_NA1]MDA3065722.1 DUF3137 domain-containing protein [Campylobacter sp. CN_NE4]MDA3069011.1 DUF3137 domain-containing protein [Campylobacter sp. CN_NE3]MDA3083175.1 DUF3137 domain-containing protein [Campylobacter sp. CN_EL2]MDA3084651.1 DUF3137 domain-containing protein [Campylobacter sp. CN_NE1]
MGKDFKNSSLKELLNLERERKEAHSKKSKRNLKAFFTTFLSLLIFALWLLGLYIEKHDSFIFGIGFFGFAVVFFFYFKHFRDEYEMEDKSYFIDKYKDFYLKRYVNSLGFEYSKYGMISLNDIYYSNLFSQFQLYGGNDLVSGKIDDISFKFCDLLLKRKMSRAENGEEYGVVVFQGLLFVADFNKKTQGRIIVMPKTKINKNGYKKIKMDNSEFNDEFSVFGSDIQQTMYILTPAFMERILRLKRLMKCPISLSFLDNKIFIKIDRGYDSFEPNLNKSIISQSMAPRIKAELNAMFDIVKILKLNSKIWIVRRSDEPNFL